MRVGLSQTRMFNKRKSNSINSTLIFGTHVKCLVVELGFRQNIKDGLVKIINKNKKKKNSLTFPVHDCNTSRRF